MGSSAFKEVAAVAKLKKWDFKALDKVLRNYDCQPFHIDGKIEVDIEFDGETMKTPIYIKVDAAESLLLSKGVCRQLGIISYHLNVQDGASTKQDQSVTENSCTVLTVRVCLIQDIRLLPDECVTIYSS